MAVSVPSVSSYVNFSGQTSVDITTTTSNQLILIFCGGYPKGTTIVRLNGQQPNSLGVLNNETFTMSVYSFLAPTVDTYSITVSSNYTTTFNYAIIVNNASSYTNMLCSADYIIPGNAHANKNYARGLSRQVYTQKDNQLILSMFIACTDDTQGHPASWNVRSTIPQEVLSDHQGNGFDISVVSLAVPSPSPLYVSASTTSPTVYGVDLLSISLQPNINLSIAFLQIGSGTQSFPIFSVTSTPATDEYIESVTFSYSGPASVTDVYNNPNQFTNLYGYVGYMMTYLNQEMINAPNQSANMAATVLCQDSPALPVSGTYDVQVTSLDSGGNLATCQTTFTFKPYLQSPQWKIPPRQFYRTSMMPETVYEYGPLTSLDLGILPNTAASRDNITDAILIVGTTLEFQDQIRYQYSYDATPWTGLPTSVGGNLILCNVDITALELGTDYFVYSIVYDNQLGEWSPMSPTLKFNIQNAGQDLFVTMNQIN